MFYLESGSPQEAIKHLERTRELQEQLHRSQPEDPNILSELGAILNDCGMAMAAAGRRDGAIEAYRQAIGHQRNALRKFPESHRAQHFLRIHLRNLSRSLRAVGRSSEAASAARECLDLWPNDAGWIYDTACELSLCIPLVGGEDSDSRDVKDRYARWAIDALRRATDAGFHDFAHMRRDTDLDPLRARQDFQLLMMDLTFPADPFAS
jgi:tetratricopeptide (TPR) repeat protein